jgi:hypothetical protein
MSHDEHDFDIESFVEHEVELSLKRDADVLATLMKYYDGTLTPAELGESIAELIDKTEDNVRLSLTEYDNERKLRESENN